ncbi:MAG TPA: hypothetical protein ENK85_08915 [Saprospiraceae bacterium]|nr:hypothetical protein [Saprospiraceae bacterium]
MHRLLFVFFTFTLLFWGCVEPPNYPNEPVIEFLGLSKQVMRQGSQNEDTMVVRFSFTDGDGDLGAKPSSTDPVGPNVFLIDSRDGYEGNTFQIPFIPEEGAGNGISGTVDLKIFTACCIFDDGTAPCGISPTKSRDTLYYSLYIQDRAGHRSNEIQVGPIYLLCE